MNERGKILITGGAGFIGSNIVDRYVSLGYKTVVVDNLSTGRMSNVNPQAVFYKLDIRNNKELEDIFKKERPDIVNHHAAQMDIRKSVDDPIYDAQVNIIGSLNVIQNAVKYNVKKFIFASSGGAVYGEPEFLPVPETHSLNPTSPYGVSKLSVEKYLFAVSSYSGFNYTILRYGNVYGPRQNPEGEAGVCAIFIGRIMQGKACVLYGNGEPMRDYIYVDDIADANLLALTKGRPMAYNIGTGAGTKVSELYRILGEIRNIANKPEYRPLRQGELNKTYLECAKAKSDLGWIPKTDLKTGLQKTLNFFLAEERNKGGGYAQITGR